MTKIKNNDFGKVSDRTVYLYRATVSLHNIGKLNAKERAKVIIWLRQLADDVRKNGDKYASRFTARFLV